MRMGEPLLLLRVKGVAIEYHLFKILTSSQIIHRHKIIYHIHGPLCDGYHLLKFDLWIVEI